ncbi:SDR family oxidoreductase [Sphingobium sp.]|uniref:SDR family oxidoreductase n=1 Tax=Sphingobium sp. TaxID=1912891 RepID=UPI0028BE2B49|nr:SDR family oxidoreductase [Sphingobium sp.]
MISSSEIVKGRNVIISGGAAGAGRVIAEKFADAGARVAVADVDKGAVARLTSERPDILGRVMDVSVEAEIDALFAMAEDRLGPVDVVINNVGIAGPTAALEDVTLSDWEQSLRVNLTSHFLFARRAVRGMKNLRRGLILNISSGSAKTGLPLRLPYVVSKGAVLSMTMNLARELGPFGIRVNAILPGAIRGERIQRVITAKAEALGVSHEDYEKSLLRYVSLRTMVEPDDLAAMAVFLASESGVRITGQMIGVDGNIEYEE